MTRRVRGIYRPPPEHGRRVHYDLSYHGLVSGGGVEARDADLGKIVVASHHSYPRDESGI